MLSAARSTTAVPTGATAGAGPGRSPLATLVTASWPGRVVSGVALALAVVFPLVFSNPAITTIAVFTLIYITAASAWNLFAGFSGYTALGNAAFYGTGAYTVANITKHAGMKGGWAVFALLPVAAVAGGLVAIPIGWLALRTRKHTFVVITIAIFFIFQLLAYNLTGITNGSSGMSLPIPTGWGPVSFNDHFYYVALALVVVAVAASWQVRRSRFGLDLLAIRDDEDRARGLGVSTGSVKLTAFIITGAITAAAGGLYGYFVGSIYPPFVFEALFDVTVALMSFLGGRGTVAGPVLGALILEPLQQYFTLRFSSNGTYLIAYGVLFLLIMQFLPQDIVPSAGRIIRRRLLPPTAGVAPAPAIQMAGMSPPGGGGAGAGAPAPVVAAQVEGGGR